MGNFQLQLLVRTMPQPHDIRLLTKVSKLHYEQGLTPTEIAGRLYISRQRVSYLLRQARREGIVQITVLTPSQLSAQLDE